MSIFTTYSPKTLWMSTLELVNILFHVPPLLESTPSSYLKAVIIALNYILNDLKGIFKKPHVEEKEITIEKIHQLLCELETILFNSQTEWSKNIEGCQKYTKNIIHKLNKQTCQLS